ncbi:NAD(P)-dependent oxidoreductase [Lichenicola sp.]|uniref:NAD(P)-dependent oxidoreductase n=1 Tax=Lichenicola sp. TaxID=2804529 RepID=UPI003B00138F
MTERIGFAGVGLMGHGMAKNLLEKGFPLTVLGHRKREAVEDLKARGATEAGSARELAEASDIVVLCVTGSPQVRAIVEGPDGLAAAGRKLLVIDCSTSEPSVTTALAASLAEHGITFIDAPLSRTPKEAWAGTLDVMVGGAEADVARARPVLEAFAGRIVETGPVGTGHMMKLLNNFVSLGYAALYAEALSLGAKAGVTAQTFFGVIGGGRMDCPFFQTFFEYVVGHNPEAHKFTLSNALKDLTYLSSFAGASATANPVNSAVRNSFALAVGLGHADGYVPTLADIIAQTNGLPPPR